MDHVQGCEEVVDGQDSHSDGRNYTIRDGDDGYAKPLGDESEHCIRAVGLNTDGGREPSSPTRLYTNRSSSRARTARMRLGSHWNGGSWTVETPFNSSCGRA